MTTKKNKDHYVNNKDFLEALVEYKKEVEKNSLEGKPKPQVSRYIGECFIKIATHLSYKPNFINYMFRDEMISDGVENCIQYIDRFDLKKSSNPFAYFTQIIYYAFLRRIQKEKRQLDIKSKIVEKSGYDMAFDIDKGILSGCDPDYTQIKENVYTKLKNK